MLCNTDDCTAAADRTDGDSSDYMRFAEYKVDHSAVRIADYTAIGNSGGSAERTVDCIADYLVE